MATLYFHSFLVARLYVVVGVYSPRVVRKVVGGGGGCDILFEIHVHSSFGFSLPEEPAIKRKAM